MGKKKELKKAKGEKRKRSDGDFALVSQAVTQAARTLRTEVSRSLLDAGLYAGQDGVMTALATEDGLTTGQLAKRLQVKAPTMTRTIGRMEAQGFVERRGEAKDQRLSRVFLTPTGRGTLSLIEQSLKGCGERALEDFSGKEIRQLAGLLARLERNLSGRPAEIDQPEPEEGES